MPAFEMPNLGVGTYRFEGEVAERVVATALELGYRHIDTAQMYNNEAAVGAAVQRSGIPRSQVFLTTKIWVDALAPERLHRSVDESLDRLATDYVDLLLLHWPNPAGGPAMADSLAALAAEQAAGRAHHIGVSNYTRAQLDDAAGQLGTSTIYTNQIEVHPFLQNRALVAHCKAAGIKVTAYMPLAVGSVARDPTLIELARARGVTPAAIALAWIWAQGMATIPSSRSPEHLADNWRAQELTLNDVELATIAGLDRGERHANPSFAPSWDA